MLSEGRIRWIQSYMARNASFFDRYAHDAKVAMAVKFLLEMIPEVERLRASLAAIAEGRPTIRTADTGNADLDTAYNLQATAVAALKEPELGPPDFVCQREAEKEYRCMVEDQEIIEAEQAELRAIDRGEEIVYCSAASLEAAADEIGMLEFAPDDE